MGKLDDIVQRNVRERRRTRLRIGLAVGLVVSVVVIGALLLFTDLGQPAAPKREAPTHVDGVLLRSK